MGRTKMAWRSHQNNIKIPQDTMTARDKNCNLYNVTGFGVSIHYCYNNVLEHFRHFKLKYYIFPVRMLQDRTRFDFAAT